MIGALVALMLVLGVTLLIIGSTMLNEGDEHYQHIGIAQLTEQVANTIISGEVTKTSSTAVTGVTIRNALGATFAPNAFGKGSHGAHCWDVKQFEFFITTSPDVEADQKNTIRMQISNEEAAAVPLTNMQNISQDGWVEGAEWNNNNLSTAAGETTTTYRKIRTKEQPMEIIDGKSFHHILTGARYAVSLQGTGNAGVKTGAVAMKARRVTVPLTEIYFDRETIEGLLDAIILMNL